MKYAPWILSRYTAKSKTHFKSTEKKNGSMAEDIVVKNYLDNTV